MIHRIDITGKSFQVTKLPEAKLDNDGAQRLDKITGKTMWTTQVVCFDEDGGSILKINTSGQAPEVEVGDEVEPSRLVAIPWSSKDRNGIAYIAQRIDVVEE